MYGAAAKKLFISIGILTVAATAALWWAFNWWVAILSGVVMCAPTAYSYLSAIRRSLTLQGSTIIAVRGLVSKRVELGDATTVEFVVRPGKISMINLFVHDGKRAITIPLAV